MNKKKIIPSIVLSIWLSSTIHSHASETSSDVNNVLSNSFDTVEIKWVWTLYKVEWNLNRTILNVATSVWKQVQRIVPENMSLRAKSNDEWWININIWYTFRF